MPTHCTDVLRAHYYHLKLSNEDEEGKRMSPNRTSIGPCSGSLNAAVKSVRFPYESVFAKGFAQVLNFLLGLWFVLLPSVLAKVSGWPSVVWIPTIALSYPWDVQRC